MIQPDTIKLLRECDAGIKMGTASIHDVMDYVKDEDLKKLLEACKDKHRVLEREIEELLASYGDDGKEPNPMAKGMSWMKTNVRLVMNESDATIAGLMTDGCNMGVKSLGKYLNQYAAADKEAKDITRRLMALEEQLAEDVRRFL